MSIYCIADFHLSNQVDKPMHKFGERWIDHDLKIKSNLEQVLTEEDTLLIPGDISWAINFAEVKKDMIFISEIPGRKILLRGNHDYWWATLTKNYRMLSDWGIDNIDFLQNNAFRIEDPSLGGVVVAGTRGWIFPGDPKWQTSDQKILNREIGRLKISLAAAERLRQPDDKMICITHFPPMNTRLAISEMTKMMREHQVIACFFGHIHHQESPYQLQGEKIDGIKMFLTASDQIEFKPVWLDPILEIEN